VARIFRRRIPSRAVTLIVFETCVIVGSVMAATYLWVRDDADLALDGFAGAGRVLVVALTCQMCLYYSELYDFRRHPDRREMFIRIVRALGVTSLLLAVLYYWFPFLVIGRGVFMLSSALVVLSVVGWRVAFEFWTRHVAPSERLLVVGTSQSAVDLARELYIRRHELGVAIVGFVDADPARVGESLINPGIVGAIDDIPALVRARSVDRVVVSLADARDKLPMEKLLEIKLDGVGFDHLGTVYEEYTGKIAVESLRPSWFIFSPGFRKTRVFLGAKRAIDISASAVGLLLVLPLLALITLAIRLTSHGSVFYRQERVGLDNRVFTILKFRSMVENAEAGIGAVWAKPDDDRITPIGRFLRRTRFDELPQLWNVLIGDMSLVGPRPERPEFVRQLSTQVPFYRQRHGIRPGLTGWAQVRYTYGASKEDALEKLQYDLFYMKNMSLTLDLFIMVSTIKTVLLREGAR
jgi:sugar transferase (PEP-CTERM system associated)